MCVFQKKLYNKLVILVNIVSAFFFLHNIILPPHARARDNHCYSGRTGACVHIPSWLQDAFHCMQVENAMYTGWFSSSTAAALAWWAGKGVSKTWVCRTGRNACRREAGSVVGYTRTRRWLYPISDVLRLSRPFTMRTARCS